MNNFPPSTLVRQLSSRALYSKLFSPETAVRQIVAALGNNQAVAP